MSYQSPRSKTNFTANEKSLLLSLISKYKDVIENKKTDAVSNEDKLKAWQKLAKEFNSCCPDDRHRGVESLKKLYNNQKHLVRKMVAEETKEKYLTGGGVAKISNLGADNQLLLSIINEKTIYGFANKFDCDGPGVSVDYEVPQIAENHEVVDAVEFEVVEIDKEKVDEKSNFQQPSQNAESRSCFPKKNFSASRRRPATVVKTLTSSDIAEKYNSLLDLRLSFAEGEIKNQKLDNIRKDELHELQKKAL